MANAPRVAVIGAGFGGLAAAIELKRAGLDDITIFERGDGVGGVWRANTRRFDPAVPPAFGAHAAAVA